MIFVFLFLTNFTLYNKLCITRLIHLTPTNSNLFFFMAEKYFIVYMYHNIFIHPSVSGDPGCFHVQVIVNSAAMNIRILVSF